MFIEKLIHMIPGQDINVSDGSISNVFLNYCACSGQEISDEHFRLAAGLEYLDFGVKTHYEKTWSTYTVLSGDQYYAMGLKKIAESGLDFVSSVTKTLMKITQAYANELRDITDYLNSFALWQNIPNFKNFLAGLEVPDNEPDLFAMTIASVKGDLFKAEIRSSLANCNNSPESNNLILKVFGIGSR